VRFLEKQEESERYADKMMPAPTGRFDRQNYSANCMGQMIILNHSDREYFKRRAWAMLRRPHPGNCRDAARAGEINFF
jgi:hypothetical protein